MLPNDTTRPMSHLASRASHRRRLFVATVLGLGLLAVLAVLLLNAKLTKTLAASNLLINGGFSSRMSAWWTVGSISVDTGADECEVTINSGGSNPWDVIVGQSFIPIESGETYTVSFDARSTTNVTITVRVQEESSPYTTYWEEPVGLTTTMQSYQYVFVSGHADAAASFQFQMGGVGTPVITIDNVSLEGAGPPSSNLVKNGDFATESIDPWWTTTSVDGNLGGVHVDILSGGSNPWDSMLGQNSVEILSGETYTVSFQARATEALTIAMRWQEHGGSYTVYFGRDAPLTTNLQTFVYTFTSAHTDANASFQFQMGGGGTPTVYIDDVIITVEGDVGNLLLNGDFTGGMNPWWITGSANADVTGICAIVTSSGVNPWDAILGQFGIPIELGEMYKVTFDAYATEEITIGMVLQEYASPYTTYFGQSIPLSTSPQSYSYWFTSAYTDAAASLSFHLGGLGTPTVCVNNVELSAITPGVRVNQVGYLPDAPKRATVVHAATTPLTWELRDSGEVVVASGSTTVFGSDSASGDHVHIADFSAYTTPGVDYTLKVDAHVSHPFDISKSVYRQLKYDALAYHYHSRSGSAITMPYAGGLQWTRPAGHVNVSPNQGDYDVTCFDGVDLLGKDWPDCGYSLDVVGGHYDAGDQGKYAVTGGLMAWTMMNQYERAQYLGYGPATIHFADGTMNIPESDNGVPDILDEARWELEFLMRMQIPLTVTVPLTATMPMTGMVHHKVHDVTWGPGASHENDRTRYLYPPSTAATLDMAAAAAQCARIWEEIDPAFSAQCLTAAETAWDAALAHPAEYAEARFDGGGPYDDTDVTDEFYWAAAELYITTGEIEYQTYISNSVHFMSVPILFLGSSMTWLDTAALGTISLAVVPNDLASNDIADARTGIIAAADIYTAALEGEGYLTPFAPGGDGSYPWGSNWSMLNNMVIMALAYDFTGHTAYLDAVSEGMDYLLGRNPMDQSYITGYGEHPLQNPTHSFWAHQRDPRYPPPPPGVMTGGPNSGLEDAYASAVLVGCAPQKCYVDHISAYSTNEPWIVSNALLAWVVAFLDEQQNPYTTFLPLAVRNSGP